MKLGIGVGIFVAVFIGMFAFVYGAIRLDMFLNPWLKEVSYSGWFWFSAHSSTLSYINGTRGWIIAGTIISAIWSVGITLRFLWK